MVKAGDNVSGIVCANTIRENEKRVREARIKNQGKDQVKQDLNKLFTKLNQATKITNGSYGPVPGFPPGSWWGIRMDCSRDRVHEPFDADIHEGPFGVISICTSSTNVNEDVDLGDFLTLTGQVYHEEQPNVDPFICNYKNQIPLRLIRSYNLQNDIAPNTGYRYDGLYVVMSCWMGMTPDGTKYNKFTLMRLIDQESPSWNSKIFKNLSSTQHVPFSTRSICSNAYSLRKYSLNIGEKRKVNHRNDHESLPVESLKTVSLIDTSRKSIPESSIVMRHVFKKPLNNTENTILSSELDRKTLTCLGASTTKTHSTNISIRMGLYESSHNAQDAKKSVSTMLHKPAKPLDIANHMLLDIESVRMPVKEDSKLPAKIDANNARVKSSVNENVSSNGHIVADNVNDIACPVIKRKRNLCSIVEHSLEYSQPAPLLLKVDFNNDTSSMITCKEKIQDTQICSSEHKLNSTNESIEKLSSLNESIQKLNSFNKSIQKLNSIDEPQPYDSVTMQDERLSKRHTTSEISSEPLCAQNINSLDSLTPDKILNLINKEKHHPLSKMLIGNVIGLTLEECAMLNTTKTTTLDAENKTRASSKVKNLKKRDNAKENFACLDSRRYFRYSKSKRLSWKVAKQSDAGKLNKILPNIDQSCNDINEKHDSNARVSGQNDISKENEYLSPFRVQTSLTTSHTHSLNDIKTRLRADKSVLVKQEFSNSSIKKSRYKKRDREIANLSIDANFGPMPRGPRNRRLRCRNNTYANKNCCSTAIYSPSKRYKSTFKRKSKLTKISRQHVRDREAKNRYRVANTLHAKDLHTEDVNLIKKQKIFKATSNNNFQNCSYDANDKNERKESRKTKSKLVKIDVDDRNISKTSINRNLRNKLARTTVPLSHHADQTPHLHYYRKKTQVGRPNMMDATTQCRLISENPEICVIGHLDDDRAILKIEWPKFEELKSKSDVARDNQKSQIGQTRFCSTSAFTKDNVCYHKDGADSMKDKQSAFVPVHMFDSDLRIARLRSIGFKPIIKPFIKNDSEIIENVLVSTSKVTKRDVAEEYNKYMNNEDNNMVVYMDEELQYQDIEEEDNESALTREYKTSLIPNMSMRSTLKSIQLRNDNIFFPETLPSRENLESPWHGWKKIVTNNRSYWIGW